MTKLILSAALVASTLLAHAAPIVTLTPPLEWSLQGAGKLTLAEQPAGGPGGQTWTEVTYAPGVAAGLRAAQPFAVPPGALLKVW